MINKNIKKLLNKKILKNNKNYLNKKIKNKLMKSNKK
jgi:hypothetical protein